MKETGTYIGIDLGTSSVKLLLTDAQGKVLGEASREYSLLQPAPGWKEIEAQTWWQAVQEALEELLGNSSADSPAAGGPESLRETVRGIGVTGQMHSLVLLDGDGEPVRPVLMWNDTRTKELIPDLKAGVLGTPSAHIAQILSTGSPAANLYWVKKNEPDRFDRIRHFLIGPDYIVYRLTGVPGTDYCEASTSSMYDLIRRKWSPEMLALLGIGEDVCPPVRGSAETAGRILPALADRFGLPADCRVVVGTGDNPAASIPTGCLGSGWPVLSLGTSGVLMFPRQKPDFEARGKNILFAFGDAGNGDSEKGDSEKGREAAAAAAALPGGASEGVPEAADGGNAGIYTLTQGVVQSCGSGYNWLIRQILEIEDFSKADAGIDLSHPELNRVMFYPHMTGDKTIYQDPTLRGAFLGLGTETTRSDMIRAFMEGIAYAVRELIEAMELAPEMVRELRVIGGGARSRVWMQIFADVLDTEILQLEGNAGAGCGAAMLAAYACGEITDPREIAARTVTVREHFRPNPEAAALYRKGYERYRRIHDALTEIYAD